MTTIRREAVRAAFKQEDGTYVPVLKDGERLGPVTYQVIVHRYPEPHEAWGLHHIQPIIEGDEIVCFSHRTVGLFSTKPTPATEGSMRWWDSEPLERAVRRCMPIEFHPLPVGVQAELVTVHPMLGVQS